MTATGASARLGRSLRGFTRSPNGRTLLVAAGTFSLAVFPLLLAWKTGGVPAFWLANAVLLVAVLRAEPQARPVYLAAGFIGNVVARRVAGDASGEAVGFALCDAVEVALAAALFALRRRRLSRAGRDGRDGRELAALTFSAAAAAPAVAATLAVTVFMRPASAAVAAAWGTWFVRDAFGMAMIVPFGIALEYRTFVAILRGKRLAVTLPVLLSLLSVDVLAFAQESYPLLFVTFPMLVFAALRLGVAGSAVAIFVTALVAAPLTFAGHGVLTLAHAVSLLARLNLLQLFLTVATWTTLPIAMVLRDRDVMDVRLREKWRTLAESHGDLEERNARIGDQIALKEAITAALPSRQAVIEVILTYAQKRTEASGAMMDRIAGDDLVCEAATGALEGAVGARVERAASLVGARSSLNDVLFCGDAARDERVDAAVCRQLNVRSMLVLPIAIDGVVSGALRVTSDRCDAFDPSDVLALQLVVEDLSSALRAARSYERMELAEAEAQATIDNLTDAIVVFRADGAVLRHNAAAERVLGLSQEQVQAWASKELVVAVDVNERELSYDERPVRRALLTGEPQRDVVVGVGKLGVDRRWISMTVTLVPSSTGPHVERLILSARDVTGLQQSELDQREYARQLSSLHLIASEITHTGKEQVLAALALCREELDMDSGVIGVIDEATLEFVVEGSVGHAGAGGAHPDGTRLPLTRTLVAAVLDARDVLCFSDLSTLAEDVSTPSGRTGAYIAVPLRLSERVYGAIEFTSRRPRPRGFLASERDFVRITADLVASAIERRHQRERLDSLAHRDALTGLPNRLVFEARLAETVLASKRDHLRFAVLYIDLDGFKAVNDTYGHGTGDEVLRIVARRMEALVRQSDTVARIGGDEFLILAPDVDSWTDANDLAWRVVETMRRPMAINGIEHAVRASVGTSVFPEDGIDADSMVRGADAALYRAKGLGKNSVGYARELARTS